MEKASSFALWTIYLLKYAFCNWIASRNLPNSSTLLFVPLFVYVFVVVVAFSIYVYAVHSQNISIEWTPRLMCNCEFAQQQIIQFIPFIRFVLCSEDNGKKNGILEKYPTSHTSTINSFSATVFRKNIISFCRMKSVSILYCSWRLLVLRWRCFIFLIFLFDWNRTGQK